MKDNILDLKTNLSKESASFFLQEILTGLDKANIPYCIERNYENYPRIITGDVDILVNLGDIESASKTTCNIALKNGWKPYIQHETHQAVHLGFYSTQRTDRFILVIEFFSGGVWKGFQFLDARRVIQFRERHGITWKPHPSHQAIITLIHHLLYNNTVFEKYRESIYSLYQYDKNFFTEEVSMTFGRKLGYQISLLIKEKDWSHLAEQSPLLRVTLVMRAFILSPINTLKSIIILKLRLRKKPQGLMINILAHDEYDFLFAFAEAVIALGNKFHIYLPPNRKIIRILSNINSRALAEVRKTITSGGVAILLHSVERKDFYLFSKKIKYDGPKIVIYKLKTKIFLEINTEKYLINCSDDKSMALVFWDYLLKSIVATI